MTITFNTQLLSVPGFSDILTNKDYHKSTFLVAGTEIENINYSISSDTFYSSERPIIKARVIYSTDSPKKANDLAKYFAKGPNNQVLLVQTERNLLILTYKVLDL